MTLTSSRPQVMLKTMARSLTTAALVAAGLTAGCGEVKQPATATKVVAGASVVKDSFDGNVNGWLTVPRLVTIAGGEYTWLKSPNCCASSAPDTLTKLDVPDGVTVSITVAMTHGAALRGLTCRETADGTSDDPNNSRTDWYELGIDGHRALIRRMQEGSPPKVIAAADSVVANGRRVKLTASCVPDGDGLLLTLAQDGREVVRGHDDDPIEGAPGTVGIWAYARPDSDGAANLIWDDFELRAASIARS